MGNLQIWRLPIFLAILFRAVKTLKRLISKAYLNFLFKSVVLLLLLGMLYFELVEKDNLPEIWSAFKQQIAASNRLWLLATLVLMPLNWLTETMKWLPFVRRYEPMSVWKALRAILAGVSFSLFTPNRIGEYGGRILFVRPEHHWKVFIANVVGNFSQFMVLLAGGTLGALWLVHGSAEVEQIYLQGLALAATTGLALMFFVYFNIGAVVPLARRIPMLHHVKRFAKDIRVLEHFSRRELGNILGWAMVRYAIYSTQYFCLLRFFDIKTGILDGYAGISAIFLLQTSIPLPPLMGLVARGNLAVQMWSRFGANEVSALAATFALWIINLILPALVGTFSLLYVNIAKSLGYDDE
jgi:hypothetical protein